MPWPRSFLSPARLLTKEMHRILTYPYTRPNRLLASLTLSLILTACGGPDAHALVEQAKAAQARGDVQAAIVQLKSALQADEKHSEARLLLGKLYLAQGDFAAAEKELARARGLGQSPETVNPLLAEALLGLNEHQRLLDELPLPDAGPARARLLAARAQAYLGLQQVDEAQKVLAEAFPAFPSEAELHFAQARLDLARRQTEAAVASLDRAISLDPRHADYRLLKGEILRASGKPADAAQAYREVLQLAPEHAAAHLALAALAIADNRLADAREETERVLKRAPNHLLARYTRALIAFRGNQPAHARDDLAPVLKHMPNYLPAVLLAGAVEYSLGAMEAAETHLKKVLAASPDHAYARRLLAAAQLKRGQIKAAEDTLTPLDPANSADPATLVVAGEIALAKKDFAQAEQRFAQAAKLKPDSAAIRTELGLARLARGDSQAIADLQASAAMDADNARADTLLILTHLKRKEFDQALAAIDRLEKKLPGRPQAANYRGAALLGKNDAAGARKQFERALARDPTFFPAVANLAQLDAREGKPQAARARYEALLKADPKNQNAMLALAEIEGRAGNEAAYVDWLSRAARAQPGALAPRSLLAQHYLRKNDPAKALALAREAYTAQPNSAAALELLGNVQLAAGEKQNAKDSFSRLAALAPDSPAAHFKLAQSQLALNELEPARKSLLRVLELNASHAPARQALAQLLVKSGQAAEALKQAEALKRAAPGEPLGHLLEGDIHMSQQAYAAALAAYEAAAKLRPDNAALLKQVAALRSAARDAEADQRLVAWIKSHPDDQAVRLAYAEARLKGGQYAEAAQHYAALNEKRPGQFTLLNNLAYAYAQMKDKRAVTYAEQAYTLQPDNPAVLDTYGWALTQTGDPAKALPLYQKALSKAPDAGDIQYHYAVALAASGDKPRAVRELKRLLDSGLAFSLENEARALQQTLARP